MKDLAAKTYYQATEPLVALRTVTASCQGHPRTEGFMSRQTTAAEEATRMKMSQRYKAQEHALNGFNDWGQFTAHVVHSQREEIRRLRQLLLANGIDPPDWSDPLT